MREVRNNVITDLYRNMGNNVTMSDNVLRPLTGYYNLLYSELCIVRPN